MENRKTRRKTVRTAFRAIAAAVLAAAFCSLAAAGMRMQRAFLGRDTLAEAQNWIYARFPRGWNLAFDEYLGPTARDVPCVPSFEQRLPEFWPGTRRRGGPPGAATGAETAFYLRNASFPGRLGNRFPASRRLLPEFASNETAFARSNALLAAWHPAPGGPRPVFAQHDIELWALCGPGGAASPWRVAPPAGAPVVDPAPKRPVALVENSHAFRGADVSPAPLGAIDGLKIVGKRRRMQPPPGAGAAVFYLAAGPAPVTVCAEGSLLNAKFVLSPGRWAVLPIPAKTFGRRAASDPFPGFRVRMRGDDQNSVCIGFFAKDEADALRLLRAAGADAPSPGATGGAPGGASGEAADAASAGAASSSADAAVEAWRAGTGPEPRLPCGVPFGIVEALARHRLAPFVPRAGRRLPVWLPVGEWAVEIEFHQDCASPAPETVVFAGQHGPLRKVPDPSGRLVFETSVRSKSGMQLEIDRDFRPGPALLAAGLAGAEIRWSAL